MKSRRTTLVCAALLLVAAILFMVRGVVRGARAPWDFTGPYVGTRLWLEGKNYYDTQETRREFKEARADLKPWHSLYPPTTSVLLTPLALPDWPVAKILWLGVLLLCTGLLLALLLGILGPKASTQQVLLLLAIAVGYGALHSGIGVGQVSVAAITFALAGIWGITRQRWVLAGVLIGLATGLKPQIGGIALLYTLCTGRWRALSLAAGCVGLLWLVGLGRPWLAGVGPAELYSTWQIRMSHTAGAGGGERFAIASDERANLISLHIFLHSFIDSVPLVEKLVRATVTLGGLAWLGLYWRGRRHIDEWIAFGVPSVLGLMAVYHRPYDAMLLLPLVAWALREWNGEMRLQARLLFLATLVFAVPGGGVLMTLYDEGILPEVFLTNRLLQGFVIAHASLVLACLLGLLFWIMGRQASRATGRTRCCDGAGRPRMEPADCTGSADGGSEVLEQVRGGPR